MDILVKILVAFILSVFFARGILSIVDDITRIVKRRRNLTAERRAGRDRLYDLAQGAEDNAPSDSAPHAGRATRTG